jgi:hypothetical protein
MHSYGKTPGENGPHRNSRVPYPAPTLRKWLGKAWGKSKAHVAAILPRVPVNMGDATADLADAQPWSTPSQNLSSPSSDEERSWERLLLLTAGSLEYVLAVSQRAQRGLK